MIYNQKPHTIIAEPASSTSITSTEFKANSQGAFALEIRVNGGSGTQNSVGTFKLRHRVNPNSTMVDVTAYTFPDGPAGTVWNYVAEFEGSYATIYDLVYTRSSGTGDVFAYLDNK